ncbi:UNKNOWN [Stylonychia lemnae]|uniref:Secreted protein n=1 Tax=Stylonychia lemnae TaxID=5949 RepID=A0A078BEH3_STYLE|nr:UNKNOWN [Stylonychia lemnae]|eukprot:CDW91552.1 UNKNOWN [Stylonychia lemnae]
MNATPMLKSKMMLILILLTVLFTNIIAQNLFEQRQLAQPEEGRQLQRNSIEKGDDNDEEEQDNSQPTTQLPIDGKD